MSYIIAGGTVGYCGAFIGDSAGGEATPANTYVAEDGTTPYVAEDGVTFYVTE